MITKKIPHYNLEDIKQLVNEEDVFVTNQATLDADYIGYKHKEIFEVILNLKESDFYKSMPAEKNPLLWQDVYHYEVNDTGIVLYVKLQVRGKAVVVSFKEK